MVHTAQKKIPSELKDVKADINGYIVADLRKLLKMSMFHKELENFFGIQNN